jgi:hypothetical protein
MALVSVSGVNPPSPFAVCRAAQDPNRSRRFTDSMISRKAGKPVSFVECRAKAKSPIGENCRFHRKQHLTTHNGRFPRLRLGCKVDKWAATRGATDETLGGE